MYEFSFYLFVGCWGAIRYYYFFKKNHDAQYVEESFNVTSHQNKLLLQYFPYYRQLSEKGKKRFVLRTQQTIKSIIVQGKEGFVVTNDVKLLVGASIAQLTFGFSKPRLNELKAVLIFPDAFYSRLLRRWAKGLAFENGSVCLSWNHFLNGYEDSSDAINLGLHEFAHILRFEVFEETNEGLFSNPFVDNFKEWEDAGMPVFMNVRKGKEDFFRSYGGANTIEFFAVCIENFFEKPEVFKKELPYLYDKLCLLMQQDPLITNKDYSFDEIDEFSLSPSSEQGYELWCSSIEQSIWNSVKSLVYATTFLILFALTNHFIANPTIAEQGGFVYLRLFSASVLF
ncbi:Protein MtfA [compost metagenome]